LATGCCKVWFGDGAAGVRPRLSGHRPPPPPRRGGARGREDGDRGALRRGSTDGRRRPLRRRGRKREAARDRRGDRSAGRPRGRGDEVEVTAREYAQTLQLLELHGIEAEVIGRHGGRPRLGKARQLWSRLHALRRWARGRDFDVALAHGSHELTMTARRLGIPSSTTFDYEFAWLQHQLGCRAATRVVVPDTIPPDRLARYGAEPPKLLQYPGLKEEYYLADFEPDPGVLAPWPIDPARVLVVLRP